MANNKTPCFTAKAEVIEDYHRRAKYVEARLYSVELDRLNVDDEFVLFSCRTSVRLRIVRKVCYENYERLLKSEVLSDILPGVKSEGEFRARVREYYPFSLKGKRFLVFGVVLV